MKKIFFTAAGILALLSSYAQTTTDSTGFKSRKLKIDEINLVSSYYSQTGDHAAVTGGTGSEKLSDIANIFDVKLIRYDKKMHKQTLDAELGIDHYTSASSDQIDLKANSSASHADTRFYPAVTFSVENEKKGTTLGVGLSSSTEYDYQSFGGNISFSKKTKDKSGEFTAKFQTYIDQVKLVTPVEFRLNPNQRNNYPSASRNTFAGTLSWSQILNERLQLMLLGDIVQQNGYLSLPFHRVYFNDGSVHMENLPNSRFKIPVGFRANYFAGDRFIFKAYYRFYTDDWGLKSNTAELEMPVKITPFLSVSPFYRYYNQSAIKYFSPYEQHTAQDQYYTSNYDYSKFNSNFFGAGVRLAPPKGVFNNRHFTALELRFGHYTRNNNLNSNIISMNLKFK